MLQSGLVFLFLIYFVKGEIKCYECDSRKNPECAKTFGYTEEQAEINGMITKCKDTQVCRKTEVNAYKNKFVVRECTESILLGCREFLQNEAHVCDCSGRLCNGQNRVSISLGLILPLLTLKYMLTFL